MDFQDSSYGGHFGFLNEMILAIFSLQVTLMFLSSLESIGLSVQERKRKIDLQAGSHGGYLEFPIRMILAILIY